MAASNSVHFIVSLSIHDNGMQDFEHVAQQMIEVARQEPGCIVYDWHLDKDRRQCRLLEQYADAAAVLAHLRGRAVQEHVATMLQYSSITNFEVYGDPGAEARAILESIPATIFSPWHKLHG